MPVQRTAQRRRRTTLPLLLLPLLLLLVAGGGPRRADAARALSQSDGGGAGGIRPAVVGGQEAPRGRLRFAAGLLPSGCAGSLIREDVVLTAAACFPKARRPPTVSAVVGSFAKFYPYPTEGDTIEAAYVAPHPDYNPDVSQSNDIALVFLKACAANASAAPVALATSAEAYAAAQARVAFAGWGSTSVNSEPGGTGGDMAGTLTCGVGNLTSSSACAAAYPRDPTLTYQYDDLAMICATGAPSTTPDSGPPLQGPCDADVGAPLFFNKASPNDPISGSASGDRLLGLFSWSFGCGQRRLPAVYTRLQSYTDWIRTQLEAVKKPCGGGTMQFVTVSPSASFAAKPSKSVRMRKSGRNPAKLLSECQAACAAAAASGAGCSAISITTSLLTASCGMYAGGVPTRTCGADEKWPQCSANSLGSYRVKWA